MTSIQAIIAVLVRLWALSQGLMAFLMLAHFVPYFLAAQANDMLEPSQVWNPLILSVLLLSLSIFLWLLARPIARFVARPVGTSEITVTVSGDQLAMIGTFLIGLYLFVSNAPHAIFNLAMHYVADVTDSHGVSGSVVFSVTPSILDQALSAAVGVALFLTAFRLGPLLRSLRRAGVSKIEDSPSETPENRP